MHKSTKKNRSDDLLPKIRKNYSLEDQYG